MTVIETFEHHPHVRLDSSPERGRYLTAQHALEGHPDLFASPAYLTTIVPSWKKRVCRGCLSTSPARLSIRCRCDQCWYCSAACKKQHWSHGQAGAACQVPHRLTCPVLSCFGGSKCDADMESVLHMCLDALALQILQKPAPGLTCQLAQQLDHSDFLQLQDHSADFSPADMRDWLKACRFLRAALTKAAWQGPLPGDQDLMSYVGRIVSNNFGIYGCGGERLHAGCHAAVAAAPLLEAATICAGSQGAAQPVHGNKAEIVSKNLSSGDATSTNKKPPEGTELLPSDGSEVEGKQQMPCPTPKPLPLWPLVAKQTVSSPGDRVILTDPALQHAPCSSPSKAGHGLESLHLHEEDLHNSAADEAALLVQDTHISTSQRQTATDTKRHLDMRHASRSQPTKHSEEREGLQRPHELIGRELFITASMLNHSCEPNCVVVREAGHARIVSQGPIEERAELTISYIDVNLPLSARRRELQRNFFFLCRCSRCEHEEVSGSEKQTYAKSSNAARTSFLPKKRGDKARTKWR